MCHVTGSSTSDVEEVLCKCIMLWGFSCTVGEVWPSYVMILTLFVASVCTVKMGWLGNCVPVQYINTHQFQAFNDSVTH
jgi:hypothetical protein